MCIVYADSPILGCFVLILKDSSGRLFHNRVNLSVTKEGSHLHVEVATFDFLDLAIFICLGLALAVVPNRKLCNRCLALPDLKSSVFPRLVCEKALIFLQDAISNKLCPLHHNDFDILHSCHVSFLLSNMPAGVLRLPAYYYSIIYYITRKKDIQLKFYIFVKLLYIRRNAGRKDAGRRTQAGRTQDAGRKDAGRRTQAGRKKPTLHNLRMWAFINYLFGKLNVIHQHQSWL